MKNILILTFIVIIANILCICDSANEKILKKDYSVDNCKNANTGSGYCCYTETPKSSIKKNCASISKYQYDHISVYAKYYKTFGGDDSETEDKDTKIDCNSFYFKISSLILILLFL